MSLGAADTSVESEPRRRSTISSGSNRPVELCRAGWHPAAEWYSAFRGFDWIDRPTGPRRKEAGCQPAAGCHPALHRASRWLLESVRATSRWLSPIPRCAQNCGETSGGQSLFQHCPAVGARHRGDYSFLWQPAWSAGDFLRHNHIRDDPAVRRVADQIPGHRQTHSQRSESSRGAGIGTLDDVDRASQSRVSEAAA